MSNTFKESDHPRGQPGNKGQFAPKPSTQADTPQAPAVNLGGANAPQPRNPSNPGNLRSVSALQNPPIQPPHHFTAPNWMKEQWKSKWGGNIEALELFIAHVHMGEVKEEEEADNIVEDFESSYYGEFNSLREWAEESCKNTGDLPQHLPEYIRSAIDWDKIADDLGNDYTYVQSSNSPTIHVFSENW